MKVRRPHVVEQMTQDLALIRQAVALVGLTRATDGIKLSLADLVTELERTTRQELDFRVELRNLERFRALLADQPGIESPRPYPLLSTDDVLVMDFVEGPMVNDVAALRARGLDSRALGHRLAESYVTQIVDNGFFHADPHPGNILVNGGDIVWIDLGMVGELTAMERGLVGGCCVPPPRTTRTRSCRPCWPPRATVAKSITGGCSTALAGCWPRTPR